MTRKTLTQAPGATIHHFIGIFAGDSEKAHHGAKIALKNDFYEGATPILKLGAISNMCAKMT